MGVGSPSEAWGAAAGVTGLAWRWAYGNWGRHVLNKMDIPEEESQDFVGTGSK